MAEIYDPATAYNPALWGIPQETYDENEYITQKMFDIVDGGYQNAGVPLDHFPFYIRTREDEQEKNPISFQWFAFGMAIVSWETYEENYTEVSKLVSKPSLIGYATGATAENNGSSMNGMGMVGDNGDGGENWGNGEFNNCLRWYGNKSTVDADRYDWWTYLKLPVEGLCSELNIYALPPMYDYQEILTGNMNPWKNARLFSYEEYLENQASYPNIIEVSVKTYVGTQTSRSVGTFGYYTPVKTNTDSIWRKYSYDSILKQWDLSDPKYGMVDPSGTTVHSYCNTHTLYQGFHAYKGGGGDTYWCLCRGLDKHKVYHVIEKLENDGFRPHLYSVFDGTVDDLTDALNKMGLAWTTVPGKAANGDTLNDPDIHMPIVDPKTGTVIGETTDPEEKKKEKNKRPHVGCSDPTNWDEEYDGPDPEDPDDPHFDPEEDPEEEKEEEEIDMGKPKLGTVGVFNRCYAVNAVELQALSNYLWNVDESTFDKILKGLQLIGVNPIDAIISVILFPFEIATGASSNIRIGVVDTSITGVKIDYTSVRVFDLGTCYFYRKYKNYLDYEPYTTASLYIPYVGVIPISVAEFTKKYINVKMAVDLLTGSGQVVVYAGGIPVIYRNCKIGCQIAVTGQDSSRIASNYINAVSELASGVAGVAGGIASKNAMGAIGSAANIAKGGLDFYTAGNVPIESRGCDSPQCGFFMPQRCYLIVNRPRVYEINESIYAKSVGIACYETGNIGSFHGFSKFENVKLDISVATEEEKEQIKALLASGVYLP